MLHFKTIYMSNNYVYNIIIYLVVIEFLICGSLNSKFLNTLVQIDSTLYESNQGHELWDKISGSVEIPLEME